MKYISEKGGILDIKLNDINSKSIATIKLPAGNQWQIFKYKVNALKKDVYNLIIVSASDNNIEVDWVSFE